MSHSKHKSVRDAVEAKLKTGEHLSLAQIAREDVWQRFTFSAWFSHFATRIADLVGSPITFLMAIMIVVIWGISGPKFHYSDTWQLVINTGTTIVTFLMVFLIQNTQNRDAKAIHLKLNELVHALKGAHNELIDVEKLTDEELKALDENYEQVRKECERRNKKKPAA
jgi:low affinity Fe/Cu permease